MGKINLPLLITHPTHGDVVDFVCFDGFVVSVIFVGLVSFV